MRKITPWQIALGMLFLGIILVLTVVNTYQLFCALPQGDFRGVVSAVAAVILYYSYAFVVYRLFLHFMPLREGDLAVGSRDEFIAQVNILFYVIIFNSLIRTNFLPTPVARWVHLALGARLGNNTYSSGALLDPPLTELGANCIVGHNAVLYCHSIEGAHFALSRIWVGDNVTIGANAVVMSGVRIGDGAIVSAGAVVLKDTQIGPNEVWGGVPAKRLK